ncbi:MAG: T9SS type A sorting domain-containing protein [Flavobacteriales bacterium]
MARRRSFKTHKKVATRPVKINQDCILVDNADAAYLEGWYVDEGTHFANTIHECEELSLNDIHNITFLVYPNPVEEFVFITANTQGNYTLFNLSGKVIAKGYLKEGQNFIDLSKYKEGVYFIEIETENKKFTKKLIKK